RVVVLQLLLAVLAEPEVLRPDAVPLVPGEALLDPHVVPVLVGGLSVHRLVGIDEELQLHLLELARPENEVPRRDLVPEALADLRDPERQLAPRRLEYVLEVNERTVGGLGALVGELR